MPVTKTAKRALRSSLRKKAQNQLSLKKMDILVRKFKKRPEVAVFKKLISEVDKAAKKKIIHKNKASRIKSKASKLLSKSAKKKNNKD